MESACALRLTIQNKRKNIMKSKLFLTGPAGLLFLLATGCIHQEKMRDDLFNVNVRLLKLERQVQTGGKVLEEQANTKIATTNSSVEDVKADIQFLKGEVDTLKQAFKSGELPGLPSTEPSIAKSLQALSAKIHDLEEAQLKMLDALETRSHTKDTGKDKGADKAASNSSKGMKTSKDAYAALEARKFKVLIDHLPGLIKEAKGKEQEEFKFVYSESLFKLGKIKEAALAFSDLSKNKHLHSKQAKIQLRMGDCFRYLGDKKTAQVYYQEIIQKYPKSDEAEKAKEYSNRLQG